MRTSIIKLGWIPDLPDRRDLMFKLPVRGAKIPKSKDMRKLCSPVEDQGNIGSCVAQSVVGALEFLLNKNKKKFMDFSRLFVYFNARVLQGTMLIDSGSSLRNGVKAAAKMGACLETTWPYDTAKFAKLPSVVAFVEGSSYQAEKYERLNSVDEMKACLASGFPFVGGVSVYDSFMSAATAKTGKIAMPKDGETMQGGHALMFVGYSDKTKRFTFRNSWGKKWGDQGFGTIPYAYLADRNLSDDFWVIRAGEQM